LYGTSKFNSSSDDAFKSWSSGVPSRVIANKVLNLPVPQSVLGEHYFIKANATAPLQPKWDFIGYGKYKTNKDAFVVGAKVNQLAAPTGAQDVPLLELKGVDGKLATSIYRLATRGGQPPASCKSGDATSVKYTSHYCKSSIFYALRTSTYPCFRVLRHHCLRIDTLSSLSRGSVSTRGLVS
jgi:hypothetical protein